MKKLTSLLIAFIFMVGLATIFESCKKDEEEVNLNESSGTGTIEYMGKTYDIRYGLYEYYGEFEGIYNYRLYLFSDGVDIENETGMGNVLAIYFYGDMPPLQQGTIPYNSGFDQNIPSFDAQAAIDYNLDTETGIRIDAFSDGELTITNNSGNNYTITFSLEQGDGELLTGQYTGKVSEF